MTNLPQKSRTLVCGYVMIHDQVHTTCTASTETPLLLAPSLSVTETWEQDIELELMPFRYGIIVGHIFNAKYAEFNENLKNDFFNYLNCYLIF